MKKGAQNACSFCGVFVCLFVNAHPCNMYFNLDITLFHTQCPKEYDYDYWYQYLFVITHVQYTHVQYNA